MQEKVHPSLEAYFDDKLSGMQDPRFIATLRRAFLADPCEYPKLLSQAEDEHCEGIMPTHQETR